MNYLDHDKSRFDRTLRLCEICRQRKPKELGGYIKLTDGIHQKWGCRCCYELRNRR